MTSEDLYQSAVSLLAQRDYTRQEISRKLELLADDDDSVDAALSRLEENGYLSDARFIEYFIRTRINKGHGPMRIQQDLRKKGVDSETAALALEEARAVAS